MNLLLEIASTVTIAVWNFLFCNSNAWMHYMTIQDDIITDNRIEICEGISNKKQTLVHELWHQYWFLYLSINQRNQFRDMQSDNREDYISLYSMQNELEDFADIFASIYLWWKQGSSELYKKKEDFIRKLINSYE